MSDDNFVTGDEFSSVDFDPGSMVDRQFDSCRFVSCTFRETDLRSTVFDSCSFTHCDFILPKIEGLTLRAVEFEESRLMGLPFGDCNRFGFDVDFHECVIDSCMFLNIKFRKKAFIKNRFKNTDFMDCDLREASFKGCHFENAQFHNCNLQKSDFREAENYHINPEGNSIKGSKHRLPGVLSFIPFLGVDLEL